MTAIEIKTFRFLCDGCNKEEQFVGTSWELPKGWTRNKTNLGGFYDGYGYVSNISYNEFESENEKHYCPDCSNIKDIIE